MGLHPQPNDWTCGPFALKHALATLGQMADAAKLAKLAGTHWWSGTDEMSLARVARKHDCDLELVRVRNAPGAKRMLAESLKQRIPALLCVDDWEHWISVVGQQRGKFIILDSNLDPVMEVLSWAQLERRWRYYDVDYDEDEPPILYDMYPVRPRFRARMRADFSEARVRHLRRPENRSLAAHWNVYVEDLLDVCKPQEASTGDRMSMAEFLRRHSDLIVKRVMYWHGAIRREVLLKLLRDFRFVAETYGLVIPVSAVRKAQVDLAILVTMWATTRGGPVDMYGYTPE